MAKLVDICVSCRFFKDEKDFEEVIYPDGKTIKHFKGECRRKSPLNHHAWPEVYAADWCGEYKIKK